MLRPCNLRNLLGAAAIGLSLCAFAGPAKAGPILNVDGAGQLLGAQNVDLGTLGLFDIDFVEGSCDSVFLGCDPAGFDFATFADAEAAGDALLDQVLTDSLLGLFDTDPTLTFGCASTTCQMLIPFALSGPTSVFSAAIDNTTALQTGLPPGGAGINGRSFAADTTLAASQVFVDFSPAAAISVPEPATLALFGFGLAGLAVLQRRRRQPL